jgi:hypothetical protein
MEWKSGSSSAAEALLPNVASKVINERQAIVRHILFD